MANKNTNLHSAKSAKNNEFYTRLEDIEAEVKHYKEHFKNKVVYCNCDDALESNFVKYFTHNFEHLGLKKFISTSFNSNGKGKVFIYEGDRNGNRLPDIEEFNINELNGNGSFDSEECVEFLKESDIVVTNPPFSLFRDYVKLLMDYSKKFLIIGNQNAITYKEIFPYIKNNELWLGTKFSDMSFKVPDWYEMRNTRSWRDENGQNWRSLGNSCWFTNLDHHKRHEKFPLYKTYKGHEEEYPKYDNYDAINIDKSCDIPEDYYGVMGVPISFLGKLCPEQFEIVSFRKGNDGKDLVYSERERVIQPYFRILIRQLR